MPELSPEISVCLCTYKRPEMLSDCLKSLVKQTFSRPFEVIVTDNDCNRSGDKIVYELKEAFQVRGMPFFYLVEPIQNIALARNRCVQTARGNVVAFIDDDERASSNWLETLHQILLETDADGAFGPVIPDIPETFPAWMIRSKLFHRQAHKDKSIMLRRGMATSNALIKRSLLGLRDGPFDKELGRTGGEDSDLFTWLQLQGFKFVWAAHAEVFERIEEKRQYLRWHLVRGYRGGWAFSYNLVKNKGYLWGFCLAIGRIFPATLWSIMNLVKNIRNPYAAFYRLSGEFSGHLGKIGYFLNIKFEEYR